MTPQDARQYAPATERNREPILEVLLQVLPERGTILEIASGTGEHAVFFASKLRDCLWLPTDVFPQSRASITAWIEHNGCDNHSFHDEISLAEKTEDLARKAMKLGLISSFVVHHFPDSWVFYIPDQNTSPTLTPEEAYLKLKKIVESSSSAE